MSVRAALAAIVLMHAVPVRAASVPVDGIGQCINLSNTLEAPKEGEWGPTLTDADFAIVKAAGFTTVRLPVRWSAHAGAQPPYTIDAALLARVHHLVDTASANGLRVILNLHNYYELDADPAANRARFAGLWRQIAASFADAPPTLWFELANEPHDKFDDWHLTTTLLPALRAVRETNPVRPVVIGGSGWSSVDSLATLSLPEDAHLVPTFHYYEPFTFTHQGAGWVTPTPPWGRAYGGAADAVRLEADVAKVRAYVARTGRVPLMGEYGAQDDARVPVAQRAAYYGAVHRAFAAIGVPGCAWGYRSGFRLRDGDRWVPGTIEAIADRAGAR